MKRVLACLISLIILLPTLPAKAASSEAEFTLKRGINIGNMLEAPREGFWGVTFKESFPGIIRGAGFDHVRLPVKWSAHAGKKAPYKLDSRFLTRVDHIVNAFLKKGLSVVLDLHHYDELAKTPAPHKRRFLAIWKQLAAHYKDYSDKLIFEPLNEPTGKLTSAIYNTWLSDVIKIIRATNPNRFIIVDSVSWADSNALKKLKLPKGDKYIAGSFHLYAPFEFTHQRAPWAGFRESDRQQSWAGSAAQKRAIDDQFKAADAWSTKTGLPVYLGEFGANYRAPSASRVRWTAFVVSEAKKYGMPWAYWEFCSEFHVYDKGTGKFDRNLLNALMKRT